LLCEIPENYFKMKLFQNFITLFIQNRPNFNGLIWDDKRLNMPKAGSFYRWCIIASPFVFVIFCPKQLVTYIKN